MTALDDDGPGTQSHDPPGSLLHFHDVPDLHLGQGFRFRNVRSHHQGQGEKDVSQRHPGILVEERCPSLGDHYGINYKVLESVLNDFLAYDAYEVGGRQHPCFQRINPDIADHNINLSTNYIWGQVMHGIYA